MSTKLTTITDKIVARADDELRQRIKEASKPLDTLLRNGCGHEITGPSGYDDNSPAFKCCWYRAVAALQAAAFELHKHDNRQKSVDAFEARVANLEANIESFRNEFREDGT